MQGPCDGLHNQLQRKFATVFQQQAIKGDSHHRIGRFLAAGFGLGYMADDFGVSGNHNLTVRQHVGCGLGFNLVAFLGFLGVQRLRQVGGEDSA